MFDFFKSLLPWASRDDGWRLIDPRPTMARNPYTFFVPSPAEIEALQSGDLIKMIFEGLGPTSEVAERMWVSYQGRDDAGLFGTLDNDPVNIPGLQSGDTIRFQTFHVISVWETRINDPEADAWENKMFNRARVAPAILDGSAPIHQIERFTREDVDGIDFPDSGWRLLTRQEDDPDDLQFVAIGVVLNLDDSILPYLSEPVGTRLTRSASGGFTSD